MSFRTEISAQLRKEIDETGAVLLSRQLQSAATIRLQEATRAYEEARTASLPYDLSTYGLGVFGSARLKPDSKRGRYTTLFVQEVIEQNSNIPLIIVTGGGPGLMEAANRGAHNTLNVLNYGITIDLPHQENKNGYVDYEDRHPEFSTRMQRMIDMLNGTLIMEGGYGSLYEALMVLQNKQTGHVEKDFLIVAHTFWEPVINSIYNRLYHQRPDHPLISKEDLELIRFARKRHEAVDIFSNHIQKWWNELGRFIEWVE